MSTTDWPRTLNSSGQTFKKRVDNPLVFRAYMFAKMPTLGITTAYLETIEVTECAVRLPFGWMTKDLFGRANTAAILAAAEAAAVSLLVLNIRNQQAALTPRPKEVSIECVQEAREDLTLRCDDGAAFGAFVAEAKALGDELSRDLSVFATTDAGQITHRVHIEWVLAPK